VEEEAEESMPMVLAMLEIMVEKAEVVDSIEFEVCYRFYQMSLQL